MCRFVRMQSNNFVYQKLNYKQNKQNRNLNREYKFITVQNRIELFHRFLIWDSCNKKEKDIKSLEYEITANAGTKMKSIVLNKNWTWK